MQQMLLKISILSLALALSGCTQVIVCADDIEPEIVGKVMK